MVLAQVVNNLSLANATTLLSVLLAGLFVFRGLYRLYPVFFLYWIYDAVQSTVPYWPLSLPVIGRLQFGCWAVQWVLYFLLVLELVDRILEDHRGLARMGRRVIQGVMVLATAAAVYTLRFDSPQPSPMNENVHLLLQLERIVTACLLIFLLGMMLFLWYFPIRLNRNTKAYCFGFTLLFLVKATAPFLLTNRGATFSETADRIHLAGVLLCQVIWLFSITQRGALRTQAFPRSWSPLEQQRVLSTLQSFEHEISRTRGR